MSTLTRAAVYTVRIAAVTAATPVLAGAAAASATAKLAGWNSGSSPAHRYPPRPGGLRPNSGVRPIRAKPAMS